MTILDVIMARATSRGPAAGAEEAGAADGGAATSEPSVSSASRVTESAGEEGAGELAEETGAGTEGEEGYTGQSKKECCSEGEPVNPATGAVFSEHIDFTLPGIIPLVFERTWISTSSIAGELGRGWHHTLDMAVRRRPGTAAWSLRLGDGRLIEFETPRRGHPVLNIAERMELWTDGRRLWATDFDGLRYDFGPRCADGLRRLTRISDGNDNSIALQRDEAGNLTSILAGVGRRLAMHRDAQNRIVQIDGPASDGDGSLTLLTLEYDAVGDLVATRDAAGQGFRYRYANHLITDVRWPAGAAFAFRYDDPARGKAARCVETTGENDLFLRRFEYDLAAGTTTVRDGRGATRLYEWNSSGRVTALTDGLGRRSGFVYDEHQRVVEEIRPDGTTRQRRYDDVGRLTFARDFDGAETSVTYAPPFPGRPISQQPTRVVEPGNRAHRFAYDGRGNLTEYFDPAGRRRRYLRDVNGLTLAVLDVLGLWRRFEWTQEGRIARESTARGVRAEYSYDRLGRLVTSRQAGEQPTRYVRDAVGNVVEIVRSDGGRVRLEYDAERQITLHRDATGNETRWQYDGLSYPLWRTSPDGSRIQYHYDADLNLVGLTNAKGERYTLAYDLASQLVEEVGFDGRRQTYEYDVAGYLTAHHDEEGRGAQYRRDLAGRLLERVYADGSTERFAYDASGAMTEAVNAHRTVEFSYGRVGELLEERQDSWVLRHSYDERGRRVATELPDGRRIGLGWGEDDSFTSMDFAGRRVVTIERDLAGREVERRAGAVTVTSAYDPQGRLVQQSGLRGAVRERVLERSYEYDADDRVVAIADLHRGMRRYRYDPCDRLIGVDGDLPETFSFDPAGNLLGGNGASGRAIGDRLLMYGDRKFEYDRCGNRVREVRGAGGGVEVRYGYGPDNQLASVEERDRLGRRLTEFVYDALGRRISKVHRRSMPPAANDPLAARSRDDARFWEARTFFQWDCDVLLGETSTQFAEQTTALERVYLHEPGTFRPLALAEEQRAGASKALYHYHLDRLGTPLEVTNDNGKLTWQSTLTAWGAVALESIAVVTNPLRFQGQYHDLETGLYYNRFRHYDPYVAQYISSDPLGLRGGLRLRGYTTQPTGWIDPLGLICVQHKPTGDLDWSRVNAQGDDALSHVMRHDIDVPGRPGAHGVFSETSLDQVEKAWDVAKAQGIKPYTIPGGNGNWIYDIPYPNAGLQGGQVGAAAGNPILNNVRIVVAPNTNQVVTAFPF
jgi:RHS repeat-associated protein